MLCEQIQCWQATDVNDPMTVAAGKLYERTLDQDERIPWAWIEKSLEGGGRAAGWKKHLLLAAPTTRRNDPDALAGYAYGAFIPGYGGYLCYVGVADWARRMGVGTCLFDAFFQEMVTDARTADESLPFVVWESHRPDQNAGDHGLWNARVKLFDRVGGFWIEGLDFLSPNFAEDDGEPVPMQLFVKPMDRSAAEFTESRLRAVIDGLHERVYRNDPGDGLYDGTFTAGLQLRLVPARLAAGRKLVRV